MGVQVGHLYRKRTVRRLDGTIRDMTDETNGGTIIANGMIVNQEVFDEIQRKEEDKRTAATIAVQTSAPEHIAEQRVLPPNKIQELEKKQEETDKKLDLILELLQKK